MIDFLKFQNLEIYKYAMHLRIAMGKRHCSCFLFCFVLFLITISGFVLLTYTFPKTFTR